MFDLEEMFNEVVEENPNLTYSVIEQLIKTKCEDKKIPFDEGFIISLYRKKNQEYDDFS